MTERPGLSVVTVELCMPGLLRTRRYLSRRSVPLAGSNLGFGTLGPSTRTRQPTGENFTSQQRHSGRNWMASTKSHPGKNPCRAVDLVCATEGSKMLDPGGRSELAPPEMASTMEAVIQMRACHYGPCAKGIPRVNAARRLLNLSIGSQGLRGRR